MTPIKDILFDKFEIIECIKKLPESAVYIAQHIFLNKKIFLKTISIDKTDDVFLIDRFKREGKILAALNHPNIIKVLDFGLYKNDFYISFEFFESKNLRDFLKGRSLNYSEKNKIFFQMVRGLNESHKNDIIHRDIKPENILINDDLELKIADYGLAFSAKDEGITLQGSVLGTPIYMSPEQVLGGKVDVRSDIFSLGITVYEMYYGNNPNKDDSLNGIINKIINFNEAELKWNDDEISAILKTMLNKNINERVYSLDEVEKSLISKKLINPDEFSHRNSSGIFLFGKSLLNNSLQFYRHLSPRKRVYYPSLAFTLVLIFGVAGSSVFKDNEINDELNEAAAITLPAKQLEIKDSTTALNTVPVLKKNVISEKTKVEKEKIKEKAYGSFIINVYPWGEVFINGKLQGVTPMREAIKLAEGNYNIKVKNPALGEVTRKIRIQPNKPYTLKINLSK